jgi:glycosyltransferase involved in cell wall biosynthesis
MGLVEQKSIETVKFIVGRTSFDSAYTKLLNPKALYFHCGEILRSSFYSNSWVANERKDKVIFVSQASYPVKGFHLAIESLAIVKKFFPGIKLRVAGLNIYKDLKLIDKLKISYYGKYINARIKHLGLGENIEFLGELNESEMLLHYLDADVFLSPSTIENSSNSLGEAMSLGLPCVASYVGGTPDLVKHGENGFLYQSDAPYMCAFYIVEILKSYKLAALLSENARRFASGWVSQKEVSERTFEIYRECLAHSTAAIPN